MWLYNKIGNLTAQPVVSAGIFIHIIHSLLHNSPIPGLCEDKRVACTYNL